MARRVHARRGDAARARSGAARGTRRRPDEQPDVAAVADLQRLAGNRAVSEALGGGRVAAPVAQRLVGLAKQSSITRVDRTRVPWDSLTTDLERAQAHAAPALDALRRANVPLPAVVGGPLVGGYAAEFQPGHWRIVVNLGKFPAATPADAERRRLIGDLYHEARHADQYYLAARYISAKGVGHRTADEAYVLSRVNAVVLVDARRDPPPRAGKLTLPGSRRKYAAAEARAAAYVTDFARQPMIRARMGEPARLVADIEAAERSLPAQFADTDDQGRWNAAVAAFDHRRNAARNQYWTGWLQYVDSTVERDAYGLAGRLGGTQVPNEDARRHMTDSEDARMRQALDRLQQAIARVLPPLPSTPPPPLPAEEHEDPPPPLPATLPPPVPEDDEEEVPATVQTKLDGVAQRHAVPDDIDRAVDEEA